MPDKVLKNVLHEEFQSKEEFILEELMDTYGTELLRLSYSYVKNEEAANDIVQDVFIAVYEEISSFKKQSSIKTWLYRIAINKCKDYLKSAYVKRIFLIDYCIERESKSGAVESSLLESEAAICLREAVYRLPVKYREVLIMFYFQDMKTDEISRILNIPRSTLQSRLSRAKKRLGNMLAKEVFDHEGS
ncbi:sigma-70 family RNA polymerase sigma factor [Metabacillus sp. RGM 3146]|uniref:sigma-70 family RNA polymerase sigma factor n=1 Tax=Metabacillus sp. RGM 3146 TaxID=3401092 RepID=UPI003B9C9AC1